MTFFPGGRVISATLRRAKCKGLHVYSASTYKCADPINICSASAINLLGKHIFDRLQYAIKATLQRDSGPHETMIDKIGLELYRGIELPCRMRDRALTKLTRRHHSENAITSRP